MGEDKSSKKEKKSKKKEKKEEEAASGGEEEKSEPKRAGRATSNVFALFNQSQIQEFKEAFTMIDMNRDGFIDESDLAGMFQQTGREPDSKTLKTMLDEAPGQLNFTNFLTLFGEKLHGTDPERTLMDGFKLFDPDNAGKLAEDYVKDLLMNTGDQFSKDEIKQVWKEIPIEGGMIDYVALVKMVKGSGQEEAG